MSSRKKHMYPGLPSFGMSDHGEKPSQRIPSPFIVLLVGFYIFLAYCALLIEDDMPRVITEKDIAKDDPNTFSEETATKYLHYILGDQARVAGTVYHFVKTRDLKTMVDKIASNANIPVRTDWQYVSGDYWLAFSSPHVNCYKNVSNIIAVLEGESGFDSDGSTRTSLLVNCHYDSVPFAIGASDNGIFCAAMVEILSKLSRRKTKLKHNIVFLFNGAEETPLIASHGFLSHPWAKGVTNVINLDAGGMNGKPNVFQVTDPRVLNVYKRTSPRPSGQGLGEFLFMTGVIPSDTDFRIWRDFGKIQGIDIAFVKGGNVYHTRNDKPEFIQDGVVQNAGNMLLSLVRELADESELENKEPPTTAVYYDFLYIIFFSYSINTALLVDFTVGVFGLFSVAYYVFLFGYRWSTIRELLWSALRLISCILAGTLTVAIFTVLMAFFASQMRYLSQQWLVLPFYFVPYYMAVIVVSHMYDSWRMTKTGATRSIRSLQASSSTRLLMSLLLLLACNIPKATNVRYIFTIPLLLTSARSIVVMSAVRWYRLKAWQHLCLELLLFIPSNLFTLSLAARLMGLLIPITGRSGNFYPDLLVAGGCVLFSTLLYLDISGIDLLFSKKRLWLVVSVMSMVCVVFMFYPIEPYQGERTTQRHYWYHTEITTYDANFTIKESASGVFINHLDAHNVRSAMEAIKNSPPYVKEYENKNKKDLRLEGDESRLNGDESRLNGDESRLNGDESRLNGDESRLNKKFEITDSDLVYINEDCEKFVFCNQALYRPRFDRYIKNGLFVRMSPPAYFEHTLNLTDRRCADSMCTLNFVMKGPPSNAITIWPKQNVTLTGWSFESPVRHTYMLEERPVFVVIETTGTYSEILEPLEFYLTFNVSKATQTDILADISHHAHKIYHPEDFTENYKTLLQYMPGYFNIATFLSFRNNYVF